VIVSTVDGDANIPLIVSDFPSVEIVTMPREKHPGHSPLGSFIQLNNAMPHVKGEWWCFASGNDYVYPNKVESEIRAAKQAKVVYSDFNYVSETGGIKSRQRFRPYDPNAHNTTNIIPDCSLIHSSILYDFMPFRTEFNNYAYWDLWLRVREKYGPSVFAHNPLATWGYRQGSADMHVKRTKSPEQQAQATADRKRMLNTHGLGRIKVLNFCIEDHANYAYENARALMAAGIDATCLKLSPHPYVYPQQADVVKLSAVADAARKADVVQLFFNTRAYDLIAPYLKRKRIFMYYAGTEYRVNAKAYLRKMNPIVERSIIALTEFAGHGAKNETFFSITVDTDALRKFAKGEPSKPYKVAHYPSNPTVKGTETIRRVLGESVEIDTTLLPYQESLKRLSGCDIYVELFAPKNNGMPYGSFGTTAVEAAAMGKVVVTMNLHREIYEKAYGKTPLILVRTEDELLSEVERLRALPLAQFKKLQRDHIEWAEYSHGYLAQGKRLAALME